MKMISFMMLVLLVGGQQIMAQVPDFDLSRYARPILSRQSLDLDLSGSGLFIGPLNPNNMSENYRTHAFGKGNLSYRSFKNSPHLQGNSHISFGLEPQWRSSIQGISSQSRLRNIDSNISINSKQLIYSDNQFFIGFDASLYYNLDIDWAFRRESNNLNELEERKNYSSSHQIYLDLPLMIGQGRIEWVQDARHALFLVQELDRQGYLSRELTEEDILAFSAHISRLKNRRYFDFRLQKIWELKQIHAFLKEHKMVHKEDVGFHAIVQDLWNFGNQPTRLAGNRFAIGMDPNIRWSNHDSEAEERRMSSSIITAFNEKNTTQFREFAPAIYLSYASHKPIREIWERSFELTAEYGLRQLMHKQIWEGDGLIDTANFSDWIFPPHLNSNFYCGFGFYPNTRTYLNASFSAFFSQTVYMPRGISSTGPMPEKLSRMGAYVSVRSYYYLSPQTRLSFSYSANISGGTGDNLYLDPLDFLTSVANNALFHHRANLGLQFAWF